jgi:membrane-associated phospholipid phosphatase
MAADLHYLTDVAVGAAVGTLYGAGVPLLHGRLSSGPGSVSYTLTF